MTRATKIVSTVSVTVVLLGAIVWWASPKDERVIVVPAASKVLSR